MGWFSKKIDSAATASAARELDESLALLRSMPDEDLGLTCVIVNHCRQALEKAGYSVSQPKTLVAKKPGASLALVKMVKDFQRQGAAQMAAGLIIWVHTVRGAYHANENLRPRVLDLWRQLSRGFPHAAKHIDLVQSMVSVPVRLEGHDRFPEGFDPRPTAEQSEWQPPKFEEAGSKRRSAEMAGAQDSNNRNKVTRNSSCPCGSGKKFKHCHGALRLPDTIANCTAGRFTVHAECQRCGHVADVDWESLASQFGQHTRLGELASRMRCQKCGEKGAGWRVTENPSEGIKSERSNRSKLN